MKITLELAVFLTWVSSSFCVTVTLEDGRKGPLNKEIDVNEPAELPCNYRRGISSSAKADIQWTYSAEQNSGSQKLIVHQGEVQSDFTSQFSLKSETILQIKSALKENAGFYECRIVIPNDGVGSGTYNVTVLVPVSKPICEFPPDFALTLGFNAEFKCHSEEGIPPPRYEWYKNKKLLPYNGQNDPRYANTSYSYDPQTGTLTIAKATAADSGTYYCKASNKRGIEVCQAVAITTKSQDVGLIVGIVFGVVFGLILVAVLIWWTWKRGYCYGYSGKGDGIGMDGDDGNDVMLDGRGPMVNKPRSVYSSTSRKQEASMMI